jgi:hypothetical protein
MTMKYGTEPRADVKEPVQDGAEVERHRVVEKRLAHHEREAQNRAVRVAPERGCGDLPEWDLVALAHDDLLLGLRERVADLLFDLALDLVDDPLGLLLAAMDEQPARALGHVAAHQQDAEAEDRAHPECEPPARVTGEDRRVEEDQGRNRPDGRADPIAPVDRQVHLPAVARRDQLVDGGVDRRILATDSHTGEEAGDEQEERGVGERGGYRRGDVEEQGGHEQLLAAVAVGELAEQKRADARARDVDGRSRADVGAGQPDAAALLGHPRGDRADDRDLQPVEDPDGAEPENDAPVETRPRQPVEPRGNLGADEAGPRSGGAH